MELGPPCLATEERKTQSLTTGGTGETGVEAAVEKQKRVGQNFWEGRGGRWREKNNIGSLREDLS